MMSPACTLCTAYVWLQLLHLIAAQNCSSDLQGLAEAIFEGDYGVDGSVQISSNGSFIINIQLAGLDTSICGGSNPYPLQYHIHQKWEYGAQDKTDKYGTQCGADYTGGHYNPYNQPVCSNVAHPNYYNCEVGDISGRFGGVSPGPFGRIQVTHYLNDGGDCLCGRLTPEMGYNRSVVFHCNDGTRLFCAPFQLEAVAIK